MSAKIVYPGSFDPLTNGHLNIIERANTIFDNIIIAVFNNPGKEHLFSMEERVVQVEKAVSHLPDVQVDSFSGLAVDYVIQQNADAILRGLRAVSDFEGELQMATMNKELEEEVETIFLMTDSRFGFLSSSLIKEVASLNGSISQFVPEHIEQAILDKLQSK